MFYTYYADVRCLANRALFQEKCKLLSPYRQQKIALLKHEKDKNRSLAAGLLLDHALGIYGLQEKARSMRSASGENRSSNIIRISVFPCPTPATTRSVPSGRDRWVTISSA